MASIDKRNGRWRARYRTPDGKSRNQSFDRKIDAERFLTSMEHSKLSGAYVDPSAGRVTFQSYAEGWRAVQVQHRPSTAATVETYLRRHAYPHLGARPIAAVRPSEVQAWVKALSADLSAASVEQAYRYVAGVFRAAVRDRVITSTPCIEVRLPERHDKQVEPLAVDVVQRIADALPARYRALVVLAAGTGLRQGECFGLSADRVDFLRRRATVDRQLVLVRGEPTFGPPKTKASVRTVPLPDVVLEALSTHLAAFPADDDLGLVFTSPKGLPIRRTRFSDVWRAAVAEAGATGAVFHELRHFYASLLIQHGESVKVVQSRLGHASAVETLDTYGHLWPDSDDQTRQAVDAVLGPRVSSACPAVAD